MCIHTHRKNDKTYLELNSFVRSLVMLFSFSTKSGELNKTPQQKLLATSKTEARIVKWCNLDLMACSRALSISIVWVGKKEQTVRRAAVALMSKRVTSYLSR